MGYGTINALGRLSSFLFLGIIVLGINIGKLHPTAVLVTSLLLLLCGLPVCLYGLFTIQKYKDVFDFEPTLFLGKQRNGKYARQVLMAMTTIGGWCSLTATVLILAGR